MDTLRLYHGSEKIVSNPFPGGGNPRNDYGPGFYCTRDIEMAREWACSDRGAGAFVNHYVLEPSFKLKTFNLTRECHILNWLAVLLNNRTFSINAPLPRQARDYILETFLPDLSPYDIVSGYRADDSYFKFASAFLNNTISLEQLRRAMRLGNLGEQTVILSERAFEALVFMFAEPVERELYGPRREARDRLAREEFRKEAASATEGAVYMIDILREKWQNDDARLR